MNRDDQGLHNAYALATAMIEICTPHSFAQVPSELQWQFTQAAQRLLKWQQKTDETEETDEITNR
jgi:hypothetical protein